MSYVMRVLDYKQRWMANTGKPFLVRPLRNHNLMTLYTSLQLV